MRSPRPWNAVSILISEFLKLRILALILHKLHQTGKDVAGSPRISQREFADHMDAETFKAVRRELGLTEIGFGRAFGVSRRTVQNWGKQGPPRYIAELLQLALRNRIDGPQRSSADTGDAAAALSPALSSLFDTALAAGWSKESVFAAIEHWVVSRRATAAVNHK